MNEDIEPTDEPVDDETTESVDHEESERKEQLQALAKDRFNQTYQSHRDDFDACATVQAFLAHDQWPQGIKAERESSGRPCLTLDHLNQYVRHVVNAALMRARDVRVLAMSGEADDQVGDVLAGLIRQITQTSSSKIAYGRGLRHACSVGFGYWRVKVEAIAGSSQTDPLTGQPEPLYEITIRPIKDPRMVLLDPFRDYPDGRDAKYGFVLTKLTKKEFKAQYPHAEADGGAQSWHLINENMVLPWTMNDDAIVVAEYFYYDHDGTMRWCVLCPNMILAEGIHHGNVMPIIRVVGDEFEHDGKERARGMVNPSSMDAQRAYNYSSSAFIESVALAPLAPFIAAEGQIENYIGDWKDAHRVPRAVLRYKPVTIQGQPVPPPQRSAPADIPMGWQGMMQNLIQDTQMIMGVAQPNVLGTGGIPVQSGAGIDAQKEPGDINTFHYHEHWYQAIEQTGRVILAMIPHVYTKPQAVKIVGDDGSLETAMLDPKQQQTVLEHRGKSALGIERVLSKSYNHLIGRYDVAMSTGPSSASKKAETSELMKAMVSAYPPLMEKAGDLVVSSMDMAGADVLAKRLKAFLPPGVAEDDEAALLQMVQKFGTENQQLKQQMADLQQIVMGEREKSQADMAQAQFKARADLAKVQQQAQADLIQQRLTDEGQVRIASMQAQMDLEINTQNNIVKLLIEKMKAKSRIDVEVLKQFSSVAQMPTHQERMGGYAGVMDSLNTGDPEAPPEMPKLEAPAPVEKKPEPAMPMNLHVNVTMPKAGRKSFTMRRPDGSTSMAELTEAED